MALNSEELDKLKFELGYPVVRIGAEPWITFSAVFDKAIAPYLTDTATTSTTLVTAASGGAASTITVASLTGFVQGSNIVVDVGLATENSVISYTVASNIVCTLSLAHGVGGVSYIIKLRGAEYVIRDLLQRCTNIEDNMRLIAPYTAGVKATGTDVQMYGGKGTGGRGSLGKTTYEELKEQLAYARDELASATGLPNLRRSRNSGGGSLALY